ncbi:MAG: helix-turn-helix transcriptional regulator, partial [Bradyrhizobium sp.]
MACRAAVRSRSDRRRASRHARTISRSQPPHRETAMPRSAAIKKPRSTTETDVKIGRRIRMRRLELGMSQTDLANAVGVTFQQIQKYERGTNGIRGSRLAAIAAALQ